MLRLLRLLRLGWLAFVSLGLYGCVDVNLSGRSTPARSPMVRGESRTGAGSTGAGSNEPSVAASSSESCCVGGQPPPMPEPGISMALGENHTCVLDAEGRVSCWGYNRRGELGVGSSENPARGWVMGIGDPDDRSVRAIAAGGYQTCALTAGGRVWCWGANHEGQVGSGEVTDAPIRSPIRVRGVENAVRLALGDAVSCALESTGELLCWGANAHHQIDDSARRHIPSATRVPGIQSPDVVAVGNYHLCVAGAGRVACRGSLAQMGAALSSLQDVSDLSAGWEHSCAIRREEVLCWGRSYLGVLGRPRPCQQERGAPTCDGDTLHPPAPVPGVVGATEIDGNGYHTCARGASGVVTCWGNNQGHAFSAELPAEPWQAAHELSSFGAVDHVYVGGVHVCSIANAAVSCVGNDWSGAVGEGASP